ncbi:hypothetical protein WJX81_004565 [Elliptochloris bilobata]|uniref:Maltase n=1 Tax=Elliptochloris bilobata TaxID=381761 RepID=A0AAW1SIU6_9CHLO
MIRQRDIAAGRRSTTEGLPMVYARRKRLAAPATVAALAALIGMALGHEGSAPSPSPSGSAYALNGTFTKVDGAQRAALGLLAGSAPELGQDISPLTLDVTPISATVLRVRIGAPGRWEVPQALFTNRDAPAAGGATAYELSYVASPFWFAVARTGAGGATVFNSSAGPLVFKDQYLEITTSVAETAALFGLGETVSSGGLELRRDGRPVGLWNRDSSSLHPDQNTYGSRPFVMAVHPDASAHGILLLNSNAMDVVPARASVSFRATGGVLDFYFLLGPTPAAVAEQLASVVGRPALPPYWSLGLMNSKYGYSSAAECQGVVDAYEAAGVPLETFISDSQYMDHDQDFTLGYGFHLYDMQVFVAKLHANGQRWVPILDPGIHIRGGYAPYDSGIAQDVFLRDISGGYYVGQVWPGAVHFPDFMKPSTVAWWGGLIEGMIKQGLELDGLWLDMNEVSNYCSGDYCVDQGNVAPNNTFVCSLQCASGKHVLPNGMAANSSVPDGVFAPPYAIANWDSAGNARRPLGEKTLAVSVRHYDRTLEYDVHNLYPLFQAAATAQALQRLRGKRSFILSRANWLGSGAYAAHWTGDTYSSWDDLRASVAGILSAGLAGIPFTGADICGFMGWPTMELCARWAAAGAWYPFARFHHADGFAEPFRWPEVARVSQVSFSWRVRALPALYTAFYEARIRGCPVARPFAFAFPGDLANARGVHLQWLLGDSLLVSPVVTEGATSVTAYLPPATWYSLYTLEAVDGAPYGAPYGRSITLQVALTEPAPVHLMGGYVLPLSAGGNTTAAARAAPLTLLVAFPADAAAKPGLGLGSARCGPACAAAAPGVLPACGHMYLDDGEQLGFATARGTRLTFDGVLRKGPSYNSSAHASGDAWNGSLLLSWSGKGTCGGNATWPPLDEVAFLGRRRRARAPSGHRVL